MALEVIYEGQIDGTYNADPLALVAATNVIVPGKVCCFTKTGSSAAKTVYFETMVAGTDLPAGIVADSTQDVIASGKVSFYTTQGTYKTDQVSDSPVKGAKLSFTTAGLFVTSASNIIATCEEAKDSAGFIKIKLL